MAINKNRDLTKKITHGVIKKNNYPAARAAKIELRQLVLSAIGESQAVVFDGFAGDGEMYRAIWHRAAGYVGCDKQWYRDPRTAFVADNRRVLRAMSADELRRFTIFDFDPYGGPWEQVAILVQRRRLAPAERLGLVLTDGMHISLNMKEMSNALSWLTGIRNGTPGVSAAHDELLDMALSQTARRMNARIAKRWQGRGKTGAAMRYIAVLLEGLQPEQRG